MKRGEHTPEDVKRRKRLQRHKKRYQELREELMLIGEIPVEPAGAIRDERVDPASQEGQSLPSIVREAIRRGWAVPDDVKPQLVDELVAILQDPEASNKEKVASFSALVKADWNQYRQDHPEHEEVKGPLTLNVNIVNVESSPPCEEPISPELVELIDLEGLSGDRTDAGGK